MMRGDTKTAKTWGAFGEAAALHLKPPWRFVQPLIGQRKRHGTSRIGKKKQQRRNDAG